MQTNLSRRCVMSLLPVGLMGLFGCTLYDAVPELETDAVFRTAGRLRKIAGISP